MTEITDLSPTDSSNTEVTGESLDGSIANMGRMDNTLQAILGMFGRWTSSDTIASAGTTDIGAQAEAYLTVSGTTTITSFGTVRAGTIRFLRFSGILTLTYNATSLILPGAASITTAVGDTAVFVSEGSGNWRCLAFQRATASPVVAAHGQCRLALDGSNLRLSPFNGNLLTIGGVNYAVPDAGVALAPTSLAAATVYYIYAYMNSGTMTLEASTTATALVNGLLVKNGDSSRTFVAWARTSSGTAWVDDSITAHVISYYNAREKTLLALGTANRAFTATSMTLVDNEYRSFFLAHSNYPVTLRFNGTAFQNAGANRTSISVAVDSTVGEGVIMQPPDTGAYDMSSSYTFSGLSSGATHIGGVFGAVSSGTSTILWNANTPGFRASLQTVVWG